MKRWASQPSLECLKKNSATMWHRRLLLGWLICAAGSTEYSSGQATEYSSGHAEVPPSPPPPPLRCEEVCETTECGRLCMPRENCNGCSATSRCPGSQAKTYGLRSGALHCEDAPSEFNPLIIILPLVFCLWIALLCYIGPRIPKECAGGSARFRAAASTRHGDTIAHVQGRELPSSRI